MDKATDRLDLKTEVKRLIKAKGDRDIYPDFMSDNYKITYLAKGLIDGWYGNELVAEAILKDQYERVEKRAREIEMELYE